MINETLHAEMLVAKSRLILSTEKPKQSKFVIQLGKN